MFVVVAICIAIALLSAAAGCALYTHSRRRSRGIASAVDPQPSGPISAPQLDVRRGELTDARGHGLRSAQIDRSPESVERGALDVLQAEASDSAFNESPPRSPATVVFTDAQVAASRDIEQERHRRWEAHSLKLMKRDAIRYREDDDLDRGKQLGIGGQGAVYELVASGNQVAKYWATPLSHTPREFEELVHKRADIDSVISDYPIHLCWPDSPIRNGETLIGYTMPMIAERFYFEMRIGPVTKTKLRELQHAIPRHPAANPYPFIVEDDDRIELVYLTGLFLEAMHRNDIAYGDFSWMNFTFSVDPVEICVLDFDSSRIQGSLHFARDLPLHSPDWEDPQLHAPFVARPDSDRYKFALFAYRMLVAKDLSSTIDCARISDWMIDSTTRTMGDLWSRSLGEGGTRPQISEWLWCLKRMRQSGAASTRP